MHVSRSLVPILIVAAIVGLALLGLWLASRAPAPELKGDVEPVPSNRLRALVERAVETAAEVAISTGQDVIPFSLSETADGPGTLANYVEAAAIGADRVKSSDYRNSIDLGFRALAAQDNDVAVLVYSGRVQHGNRQTDAVILEAYERGFPATFRFAQPYRLDDVKRTGTLDGRLYRLPDGPPHFSQSPASRHG